jgi:DNA-directed RNA polymerase specialized sigma subunit
MLPLHPDIVRAQFKIQFVKAIETYNPKYKVQLSTHVFNTMKKATRFIMKHQNIASIPEVRTLRIRDFDTAKSDLMEDLGREPNHLEMSQRLKWAPAEVARMEAERRPIRPTGELETDPTGSKPSKEGEVINMLQYDLRGEEKLVHEYLFGLGGKPQLAPGAIATKLKWTPSKVTRLKNKIIDKINEHL